MKKSILFTLALGGLLLSLGCNKDEGPSGEMAFENLNDFTTLDIETTIPRVEISQSGNLLRVLLSVTDKDRAFYLGPYAISMA